jgi:hypothetical protein
MKKRVVRDHLKCDNGPKQNLRMGSAEGEEARNLFTCSHLGEIKIGKQINIQNINKEIKITFKEMFLS